MARQAKLDQTNLNWLVRFGPPRYGTAVYLIAQIWPYDPDQHEFVQNATAKEYEYDVTYSDTKSTSRTKQHLIAFKWIPHAEVSGHNISGQACGGPCDDETPCVDYNCLCDGKRCR